MPPTSESPGAHGLVGMHSFDATFMDKFGPSAHVDCWVYTERANETLSKCLREFEAGGGIVNWASAMLSPNVPHLTSTTADRSLKVGVGLESLHHGACERYFDKATTTLVERNDRAFYEAFGYEGCCSKKIGNGTGKVVWDEIPQKALTSYLRRMGQTQVKTQSSLIPLGRLDPLIKSCGEDRKKH